MDEAPIEQARRVLKAMNDAPLYSDGSPIVETTIDAGDIRALAAWIVQTHDSEH